MPTPASASASELGPVSPAAAADDPAGAQTATDETDALPVWIVPVVIAALAAVAAGAFVVRRRRGPA